MRGFWADGDFVERALMAGTGRLKRRSALHSEGYDFERVLARVAAAFDIQSRRY